MNTRTTAAVMPLVIDDLSAFTKALRQHLHALANKQATPAVPTHLQCMNMLAKAAGYANVQALKAAAQATAHPTAQTSAQAASRMHTQGATATKAPAVARVPGAAVAVPLSANATKAAMQFDAQGRLVRWPHKFTVQRLAMWPLWMQFDAKRQYREREVNQVLNAWHHFGDPATLRRELINMGLLARKSDCSVYWKEPKRPDDDARALMQVVRERSREG